MKKQVLSVMLCLCLIVAMLPVSVLADDQTYLALGDSISTGYAPNGKVDSPFANQIADENGYTLDNKAEDGETAASLLGKLNSGTISVDGYDLITITIGGNDLMNSLYEYLENKYEQANPGETIDIKDVLANPLGNLKVVKFAFENVSGFTSSDDYSAELTAFSNNLSSIIAKIRETNADAKIIVVTQYDPYKHLSVAADSPIKLLIPEIETYVENLKTTFATGVVALNGKITNALSGKTNVEIADVYTAFDGSNEVLTNANLSTGFSLDFHPNQTGHDLIASTIGSLLGSATTPAMSVTPDTDVTFSAQTVGYDAIEPREFTVKNTGTEMLNSISVALDGTNKDSFTLTTTGTATTLNANETTTFTVAPNDGLSAGTYTATVEVSADSVTSVTVNISFTVNPAAQTGTHTVLDENNDEISGSPFANLSDALSASHDGYTVVMGSDDTLSAAIPDGVTLCVPSGITLTVASPASLSTGVLEIEAGATLEMKNDSGVYEAFVGDTSARVQLTSGSIVWKNGTLTLNSGSAATVPSGKVLCLMASVASYNTPLNAVIEEGATFTVAEGGTLKAVSGNVGGDGSKITVNGTLDVLGDITIAEKASVEVADGGVLNLADLTATDIVGSGDGTGIKGDIVFYKGARLDYNGKTIIGGASDVITLTSGKATLNLSNIDKLNLDTSYIALTVEGDVSAFGDINVYFGVSYLTYDIKAPIHITLKDGYTATIEEGSTFNLMNGTIGGSQLTLEDGAALNVNGTLEVQSNAAFTGTATVTGIVYVFGDGTNVAGATFDLSNGAVYAQADISEKVPDATKETGEFEYDSTTFTYKWSNTSTTIYPEKNVYDRNTIGTYYENMEFTIDVDYVYPDITQVELDGEELQKDKDYTYEIHNKWISLKISVDLVKDLEIGEYELTVHMSSGDIVYATIVIPETYTVTAVSDPAGMGYFFYNDSYSEAEYYVVKGESVTIEPQAEAGYHFDHWDYSGITPTIDENGILTFTPTDDTTLTAVFEENTYAIEIKPDSLDFGVEYEGYTEIDAKTVVITNNSDTLVLIDAPDTDEYVITMPEENWLEPGESMEITIRPATGLKAGNYDVSLEFSVYDPRDFPVEPMSMMSTHSRSNGDSVVPRTTSKLDVSFTVLSRSGGSGGYCTLTFDTNGGKEIAKLRVPYGKTVDLTDYTTTRYGYNFAGWYADEGLGERIDSIKMNGSKTVYAGWYPFDDVDEGDWFYDEVLYCYYNGLMDGTDYDEFSPYGDVTRAMLVTILWRVEGKPVVNYTMPFEDVASGTWYTEAVRWAASKGIVLGVSDTAFEPNRSITREEFATVLWRYAKYCGYDVSIGESTNILSYADFDKVSEYAIPALQWACGEEIITGRGEAVLAPQGTASRAEAAAMLYRFCENTVK